MLIAALVLIAAIGDSSATNSANPETTAVSGRVVRLPELHVRAARLHDPLSSQSVQRVSAEQVRTLPVDRVADLVALQAGIVVRGEQLHIRGGRASQARPVLRGITLADPQRGRAIELPLLSVRGIDVLTGGLEASEGGALSGLVHLHTMEPGDRWNGALEWHTDGRTSTHYDRAAARIGGRMFGVGVMASGEATLDDTYLPTLRTLSREKVLGGSFGWRADNRLLGHLKLSAGPELSRWSAELIGNRRVTHPYDPAFSLDGYTTPCLEGSIDGDCSQGAGYSPQPYPGMSRYIAADHHTMTDDRRGAAILAWERLKSTGRFGVTLGVVGNETITSLNGQDDASYVITSRFPVYGEDDSNVNQPFYVYTGDEPYFRRAASQQITLRTDFQTRSQRGDQVELGAGVLRDEARLYEKELATTDTTNTAEAVRTYDATAYGGFAYGQFRVVFEGLVANLGLRTEYFGPGPASAEQSFPAPTSGNWSFSPRLGVAYPVSVRDVFSLSYTRTAQYPDRDYLYDNRLRITNRRPIGNPAIQPAISIAYQAAVKHSFSETWSMQAAVFFHDVYGLVGSRNISPPHLDIAQLRYEGEDDAHAGGFEWSLWWAGAGGHAELAYTFLEARGTQSREEGVPYGPRRSARPQSIGQHPLDWDQRHAIHGSWMLERKGLGWISWSTSFGSGLPWTPRQRRTLEADLSTELTNASVRFQPRWSHGATLGLDVRNLFDSRTDLTATVDGFPHRTINTLYDDYGAWRTETDLPGGAYWNDRNEDGYPGWVRVHDPRLIGPPRTVRMMMAWSF
jgi:hypothetical protein